MITIIGSGLAGYTLAKEIRKINATIPIRLITSTNGDFYSKPILSNVLTLKKQVNQLVTTSVEKIATDLNLELLNYHHVLNVNSSQKEITIQNLKSEAQSIISYDKLVFATGSIPNATGFNHVYQVNSLDEYAVWHEQLNQPHVKKIAIIGGGLIGCEFANDLLKGGYEVHLIDSGKNPLGRLLPEKAGEFLKQHLINAGINYYPNQKVKQVEKNVDNNNYEVILANKSTGEDIDLRVDLVLGAIGIQPNVQVGRECGLEINKGIVTNQYLETSIQDIYALGDCAEVKNFWLPYVAPIMQSARALAKTLTGEQTSVQYPNMPVIVKTGVCPTVIGVSYEESSNATWQWEELDEHNLKGLYLDDQQKLLGFILMGSKMTVQRQTLSTQLSVLI